MYTIVFEEDEVKELDEFLYNNHDMGAYFDYMEQQGMDYKESINLLTALDKIHAMAEKIHEEFLRRCGE